MADKGNPNNPRPFKGTFSFVNKDAGNLSSKEHSAAVLWHVQHRYERWKKQQVAKTLHTSVNIPGSGSSSSGQAELSGDAVHVIGTSNPSRYGIVTNSSGQTQLNLPPFVIPSWKTILKYMQQPGITSSTTPGSSVSGITTPIMADVASTVLVPINRTTTEASSTIPVTTTPIINNLIAFAYQVLIPSTWPNEGAANPPSYELTRSWDDLALTNEDECYANALFSVLAGTMAVSTGNATLTQHAQIFQARAMVSLRNRIQKNQDLRNPMTFQSILRLFTSETIVGDAAAARVHLKMLRHLIVEAGGLITLDSWFKENVVCCDAYFALRYETRPHFPASEWTPGPLNAAWKGHIAAARGHEDEAVDVDASIKHRVLREVFADLRELLRVHYYVRTHTIPPDELLLRWRQLRKFDCISRLADHFVNCTIFPHLHIDPHVQTCICTAAMLWAAMVFGQPEPIRLGSRLLVNLRQRLEDWGKDEELRRAYANLSLWVSDIGVKAGKTLPGLQSEKDWFQQSLERKKQEMGLGSGIAVRSVLRSFLYSDRLQQELDVGVKHRDIDVREGIYSVSGMSWRAPIDEVSIPEPESTCNGKEKAL